MHFAPLTSELRRELQSARRCTASSLPGSRPAAPPTMSASARATSWSRSTSSRSTPRSEAAAEIEGSRQLAEKDALSAAQPARGDTICRRRDRPKSGLNHRLHEKGARRGPSFFGVSMRLSDSAGQPVAQSPAASRGPQRHLRLETFEFDPGAGTGAQQAVGRLPEAEPALWRIVRSAPRRTLRGTPQCRRRLRSRNAWSMNAAPPFLRTGASSRDIGGAIWLGGRLRASRRSHGCAGYCRTGCAAARLERRRWLRLLFLRPVTGIVAVAMPLPLPKPRCSFGRCRSPLPCGAGPADRNRRGSLCAIAMPLALSDR